MSTTTTVVSETRAKHDAARVELLRPASMVTRLAVRPKA